MKLDKKIHETHAKRLAAILDSQSTFAPHINRPEFKNLLSIEINTLSAIEKLLPESKLDEKLTANYLAKQFASLSKSEFKIDQKFKYDDADDLLDNVNYLPTYCKNIFKVNIDDVVAGKKVVAENPNINLKSKPEAGDDPMMDAAAAFNMGAMGYSAGPYDNPFLLGKASAKLNKDISEGKVYQFKTKPSIIAICKYILLVLIGICILGLIATAVFCFMANGMSVYVEQATTHENWLASVSNGIFYLITSGFAFYVYFVTLKSVLKKKGKVNENALYQFSWYFYLAFIILALLISLLDLQTTWFYGNVFKITESTSSSRYIGFKAWGIGIIVVAASAGLCIAPMIIGAVKAPKVDKQKIDDLLKQYINDITSTTSTGPEVQKPVDVKPSEDKKDPKKDTPKPKK